MNDISVLRTKNNSTRTCEKIIEHEIPPDGVDGSFLHIQPLYGSSSKNVTITENDFMRSNSLMIINQHFETDDNNSFGEVQGLNSHTSSLKEIISYQRFGKIDKKKFCGLNFKCHLCGFSCAIRETLLKHFDEEHPI